MKKIVILLTAVLALFLFCSPTLANIGAGSKTLADLVSEPVTIHAYPGMPMFPPQDEWPEIMKVFPPYPEEGLSAYEDLKKEMEVGEWLWENYVKKARYNYPADEGVCFVVEIPEYNHRLPVSMKSYSLEGDTLYYVARGERKVVNIEDFLKLKKAWAQYIVSGAQWNADELFFKTLRQDVMTYHHDPILHEIGVLDETHSFVGEMAWANMNLESHLKLAGITAEDLMFIPRQLNFLSFIPEKIVIFPMVSGDYAANGVYTPGTGRVGFSDWLIALEAALPQETNMHEYLHRSPLQDALGGYPLLGIPYDHEPPAFFLQKSRGGARYLWHPYARSTDSSAAAIMSFERKRVFRESVLEGMYALFKMDEEIWNEYMKHADKTYYAIREALYSTKFLTEINGDPFFVGGLTDELYDDNAAIKVLAMLAIYFPTSLGTDEDAAEVTRDEMLKDWPTILSVYKRVKAKMAKKDRERGITAVVKSDDVTSLTAKDLRQICDLMQIEHKSLLDIQLLPEMMQRVRQLCGLMRIKHNHLSNQELIGELKLMWRLGFISLPQFRKIEGGGFNEIR